MTSHGGGMGRVAILLTLHDGAEWVAAQLDSLAAQRHEDWTLHVGDDASRDAGPQIVRDFAARVRQPVELLPGPNRGHVRNFLALLDRPGEDAAFVAFCDQDDIWFPDKLTRALAALRALPEDVPALYGARTLNWYPDSGEKRPSQDRPRPTGFRNALTQNFAGGNTMVMNRAAFAILRRAAAVPAAGDVVSHDWWTYQIVTGAGGVALYDPAPVLLYRQHRRNQIGANDSARARAIRLRQVMSGRYRDWNDRNLAALSGAAGLLTPENRAALDRFAAARGAVLPLRLARLRGCGVYRQSRAGTIALWVAAVLGRL